MRQLEIVNAASRGSAKSEEPQPQPFADDDNLWARRVLRISHWNLISSLGVYKYLPWHFKTVQDEEARERERRRARAGAREMALSIRHNKLFTIFIVCDCDC